MNRVIVAALLTACTTQRALVLDLAVGRAPTDAKVCIRAFGEEGNLFSERYNASAATGTLVFLEGEVVRESLLVSARLFSAGRPLRGISGEGMFDLGGASRLPLSLQRCRGVERETRSIAGAFEGYLIPFDIDGDAKQSLVSSADLEKLGLLPATHQLLAAGDVNGDCVDEVIVAHDNEVFARPGSIVWSGRQEHALLCHSGIEAGIVFGSERGLEWRSATAARALSALPVRVLRVGDLNADGADDIVAAGEAGIVVMLGGPSGHIHALGATPSTWSGRVMELWDADGDGDLDLTVASDTQLLVARNRGDAFFEAWLEINVDRARALTRADLDGDCRDELVVSAQQSFALGLLDQTVTRIAELGESVQTVLVDFDGDGQPSLVLQRSNGTLETWAGQ